MPPDASAPTIESPAAPVTPAPGAPATPPGPPAWTTDPIYAGVVAKVPSKFIRPTVAETLAAQAESYSNLEKLKSGGGTPPAPDAKSETPAADDTAPLAIAATVPGDAMTEKGINAVLARAGLKGKEAELAKAWGEKGELEPAHYEALAKENWDREDVDAVMEAMKSRAEKPIKAALELAGGREEFKIMAAVAAEKMDKAMLADLNKRFAGKDAPDAMLTLIGWYHRHTETAGSGAIERGNGVAHAALPTTMAEFKALTARAMKGDRAAEAAVVAFRKSNSVASLK